MRIFILIAAVIIVLALAWYFLIRQPGQTASVSNEGKSCMTAAGLGIITNGICIPLATSGPLGLPVPGKK